MKLYVSKYKILIDTQMYTYTANNFNKPVIDNRQEL